MNKKKVFITMILTLTILYGSIQLSAGEASYGTLSYEQWKDMNEREKLLYTAGYIHGSFTVVESIIENLDSEDLTFLREYITPYYNHDIVVAVDWIYEADFFKELPVYNLINNLDEYLRMRKALYDTSVGKTEYFKGECNNG